MPGTTEFVAVNWENMQLIDEDSLDQINNNVNWLKDHSLTGQYQLTNGGTISTGLKILAGKTEIASAGKPQAYQEVYFAKAFTINSSPVVTASFYSTDRVSAFNIYGLDDTTTLDHRGFKIFAEKNDYSGYGKNSFLNWIAVGT